MKKMITFAILIQFTALLANADKILQSGELYKAKKAGESVFCAGNTNEDPKQKIEFKRSKIINFDETDSQFGDRNFLRSKCEVNPSMNFQDAAFAMKNEAAAECQRYATNCEDTLFVKPSYSFVAKEYNREGGGQLHGCKITVRIMGDAK